MYNLLTIEFPCYFARNADQEDELLSPERIAENETILDTKNVDSATIFINHITGIYPASLMDTTKDATRITMVDGLAYCVVLPYAEVVRKIHDVSKENISIAEY